MLGSVIGAIAALVVGAVGIAIGIKTAGQAGPIAELYDVPYPNLVGGAVGVILITAVVSSLLFVGGYQMAAYVVVGDGVGVLISGAVFFVLVRGAQIGWAKVTST